MTRTFVRPTRRDARRREDLVAAADEVRDHIRSVDTKASLLAGLGGAALALFADKAAPLLTSDDLLTALCSRLGLAAQLAAVVLLLLAVRPNLAGAPFMRPDDEAAVETPQERRRNLSQVARPKYRRVRFAVDLLIAAAVLIAAAIARTGAIA